MLFIPWVYRRIEKFTPSQILSITFILLSLFKIEKARNAMLALIMKFNFIEVLVKLYQIKVPKMISSYYKTNIYNIILNFYQLNVDLCQQKDLVYVEVLQTKEAPFSYVFNDFLTIFPHEIIIELPKSENDEVKNFIQNLKAKPYSIHYKNNSVEVNDQQVESFLNLYKNYDLKQANELESFNSIGKVREINYMRRNLISFCVKYYDNWIYQWLMNLSKFTELPSQNQQLKDAIRRIGLEYDDDFHLESFDDINVSNYYHFVYNQQYLFNFIIQKILLNDDEDDLFSSLFNIIIQNACVIIMNNMSSFISHNAFNPENLKNLIINNSEDLICNKCFNNFINIILLPEIRNDCDFFAEISEELLNVFENLSNKLPKQCSILISFLIILNQPETDHLVYMLSEYITTENLQNLKRIIEFLFEKELTEKDPSQDKLIAYLKVVPSIIQTRKEMIPSLINKIMSDINEEEQEENKSIELISVLFNTITPEKKEEKLVVKENLDEIDFSLAPSTRPSSSNSNKKQKLILENPPITFIEADQLFWKLYCQHKEKLSRIIKENEEYLEKFQFLANFGELLLFEYRVVLFQKSFF